MVQTANVCLAYPHVKTIVILQDDAYAAVGFVDTILAAVQKADDYASQKTQWLYIKLFNTGHYDGYSNEFPVMLELVGTSTVLALLFLVIFSRNVNRQTFVVRFGLYLVLFLLSLELLGRQNTILPIVSKHPGVSPVYHFGISNVGLVYNRQGLGLYIRNLTTSVDLVLADLQEKTNATGFVVRPNPVQHIGLVTSINSKGGKRTMENWYKKNFKESEWFEEFPIGPWMQFVRNYAVVLYLLVSTFIFSALNFQSRRGFSGRFD